MNSKVALTCGLVIGGIVGSVTTYTLLTKRYEKLIEQEIAVYRDYVVKYHPDVTDDDNEVEEKSNDKKTVKPLKVEQYTDYTTYFKKDPDIHSSIGSDLELRLAEQEYPQDDEPEDEDEDEEDDILQAEAESDSINAEYTHDDTQFQIDVNEFLSDDPDYDKVSLIWHNADDVLCDDKDERLDDQNFLDSVGYRAYLGSHDEMYIRVPGERTDYEIVKDPEAFSNEPDIFIH